ILHVSEATPIKQVLLKMQKERIHMAIVNDEYGGTAGLITVEDILEEIAGDIRDEFDEDEIPDVQEVNDKTFIVSGNLDLEEVNQIFGIELVDDEVDTIGVWMFTTNLDAQEGVIIEYENHRFIIEEMDGYQIKKVKIIKP